MSTTRTILPTLFVLVLLGHAQTLQAQITLPFQASLVVGDPSSTHTRPLEKRNGRFLVEARLYVPRGQFVSLLDVTGEPWVERSLVLCGEQASPDFQTDPSEGLYVQPRGVFVSMELELGAQKLIFGSNAFRTMFLRTQVIELHPDTDEVVEVHSPSNLQPVHLSMTWSGYAALPGWRPRVGGDLPSESAALLERVDAARRRWERDRERDDERAPGAVPLAKAD